MGSVTHMVSVSARLRRGAPMVVVAVAVLVTVFVWVARTVTAGGV